MTVPARDWLALMQREYLWRFIADRGCAIRFVSGAESVIAETEREIEALCRQRLLTVVKLDAGVTKLHMMQDVFFAIAQKTDWDRLAQRWIEAIFRQNNYQWPRPGQPVPLQELADLYHVDQTLLRQQVLQWLTRHLMNERELAQDFRSAMAHLCMRRLEPSDQDSVPPVIEWLRGELRTIGAVRQVPINAKITRHNARSMLRSLFHWLWLVGARGFVASLDLRPISNPQASGMVRYTPAAVLDAFEVLRQLIDEAESFEGLFLFIKTDETFTGDDAKRSLSAYPALKERIYAEIHSRAHENPLAPLLQLAPLEQSASLGQDGAEMPYVLPRVAIEALRAGVPNRAAIKLLGTSEAALAQRFGQTARRLRLSPTAETTSGEIIAGGFGSGKSHLIGYLAEQALDEEFVVSKVAISKETPLFDPDRVYAAAVRNAVVPRQNADVMALALDRLRPGSHALKELETWASDPQSGLSPVFAALLYLLQRQVLSAEDRLAIVRFLSGAKLGVARVKGWLRNAGGGALVRLFPLKAVKASELAVQRLRFAPALFRAAGFGGWCVLLDELELIARYTPLQRAKSYAELARWLGLDPASAIPGVVALGAVTGEFADVMERRLDSQKMPVLLTDKGLDELAHQATLAMRALESTSHYLSAPTPEKVEASLEKLRQIYHDSYGWKPPPAAPFTLTTQATMRHYIKSWITGWDLNRLYGAIDEIEVTEIERPLDENKDFEQQAPDDSIEEDAA